MISEQWQRVKAIFHDALLLKKEERSAFLEGVCADDLKVKKEVESLLRHHEESTDFMELPAGTGHPPEDREEIM